MAKRHKMNRRHSERLFTNTAKAPHPMNVRSTIMRGGYRL